MMDRTQTKRATPPAGMISTAAAARIAGLHWRTLLRWIERGVISPVLYAGSAGEPSAAYAWRLPDVLAARTISELRGSGLSAQRLRRAAVTVARYGGDFTSARLYSDGKDVFQVLSGQKLMSVLLKPGQRIVFPLDEWAATVSRDFKAELRRRKAA